MQGAVIRKDEVYYRCMARTLTPGSAALAEHPRTVNLREIDLLEPLNGWLGRLFDRDNVDRTVAALVGSQQETGARAAVATLKKKAADAEARLRRLQAAIEAGVDPAALVESINEAQAQRAAARAELDRAPSPNTISAAEVYAMIDSLGDVGEALKDANPAGLERLYEKLDVQLAFQPTERTVVASIAPRVVSERVRGGELTQVPSLVYATDLQLP